MSITIFLLFLLVSPSFSAFVAPIIKHHVQTTPYYTLKVHLKTPLQPTDLLLHIGATFTTVDCTRNYTSTTSRPVPCNSPLCRSLQSNQSSTTNCDIPTRNAVVVPAADSGGGCVVLPHNELALFDSLALHTTNGSNAGQLIVFPEFVLICSDKSSRLLQGHAKKEVNGLAGLGFSKYSLPAQVSTSSSVFAVCLSGSPSAPGVAFFDLVKPYDFLPGIDVSYHLNYTPLFSHSVPSTTQKGNTKQPEDAYFIKVKSININSKPLNINQKLLSIDKNGFGGTRISTTNPYTVLEASIFNTFIEAFTNESKSMNLKLSTPAKPFSLCYEADKLLETDVGPKVPQLDLLMDNDVIWHVFGKNSMVRIVEEDMDVWCLAVVDGGDRSVTSMVIGGHQLEDNLLQFDLGKKRLGFSSSLLQHKTMCANFNFGTNTTIKTV
ncbi:aspartic peptidase A1 family [Artemisia annua]|uniref:Aspartic peptidase A1 family n=1 Tax=Artemisia annua TaxID=35608 RepID=A0A2U1K998_ARTAN|nr:aspartic peptidase A1 family [Artemisia annua]